MPRVLPKEEGGFESHESIMGDAVPRDGVEDQAERRDHMREQTMARQAAERKAVRPPAASRQGNTTRKTQAREKADWKDGEKGRAADLREELARINTGHETWLREQEATDPSKSAHQQAPIPEGYVPPDDAGAG